MLPSAVTLQQGWLCVKFPFVKSSLYLLSTSMRQHAPMLEDEQGLHNSGLLFGALLRLTPLQGLDLHLPIDASKAAALLQHRLQAKHTVNSIPDCVTNVIS